MTFYKRHLIQGIKSHGTDRDSNRTLIKLNIKGSIKITNNMADQTQRMGFKGLIKIMRD